MATPLYKKLKQNGYSTYVLPGASEDMSAVSDTYKFRFSKFMLLNLDLTKMDMSKDTQFHTESLNTFTDAGEVLVNALRNYVANQEVVLRQTLINNNTYFYDPNELRTTTERIFWKWLRKSGMIQFEPAIPNEEYLEVSEFAINDNLPDDFFKEYLWKERATTAFTVVGITQYPTQLDEEDNTIKNRYVIKAGTTTNLRVGDRIRLINSAGIDIGVRDEVMRVIAVETDPAAGNTSKNDLVTVLSSSNISFNNGAAVTMQLLYERVVQYIGEIGSEGSVQVANSSRTEVLAYVPDHCGQTPDVLFRIEHDKNYSPGLQFPILPSQDQPEIVGGELYESPLVLNPQNYPGDRYAYFDADQKYINSAGFQDRRRGEFYGVMDSNRKNERVAAAPYVYPEFDGSKLDGVVVDFDPAHYTRMNIPGKVSKSFDDFNAQSFNNQAPKDFKFNVILWYYEVTDANTGVTKNNLYGLTIVNSVENNAVTPYSKLVSNGLQDGMSYIYSLNLNYSQSNENYVESYDETKTFNIFSFDLYNNLMASLAQTNKAYMNMIADVMAFRNDLFNLKQFMYNQTDIRDVNFKIESLYKLLDLYKRNQFRDSDTIKIKLDENSTPPLLYLESTDSRYGQIQQLPVSVLYNNENNTVIDYKISVPEGKDFMVNVINDDTSDIDLDKPLSIVLDKDLAFRQTLTLNVYPQAAKFNKQLNVSMMTTLATGSVETGYAVFKKPLNLPIDTNLNPNETILGIPQRWSTLVERFTPEVVLIRKISDVYYLVLGIREMLAPSFRSGDVLALENFNLVNSASDDTTVTSDVSGQYQIVGDIEYRTVAGMNLGLLSFVVDSISFQELYESIDTGDSNEYQLSRVNFTQPVSFRYNSGYKIQITNVNNAGKTFADRYIVTLDSFKNKS